MGGRVECACVLVLAVQCRVESSRFQVLCSQFEGSQARRSGLVVACMNRKERGYK